MKVWTEIAYCRNQSYKNLGYYYNEIVSKYQAPQFKDDWICLLDHDARFLNDQWYPIMETHIKRSGEQVKLFTALTNRVANNNQRVDGKWDEDRNTEHKAFADAIKSNDTLFDMPKSSPISGVLLLFPAQLGIPFRETGKCLGIDNYFHWDILNAGYKAAIMMNLYVYHWYRFDTDHRNVTHLK